MKIIMNFFGFLILLGNGANGITMVIDELTYEELEDVTSLLDANCAAGEIHKIVFRHFLLICLFVDLVSGECYASLVIFEYS